MAHHPLDPIPTYIKGYSKEQSKEYSGNKREDNNFLLFQLRKFDGAKCSVIGDSVDEVIAMIRLI